MFAVPMADIVRIHASSGTTGKPTVVGYTKGDIDTWSLLMARSIRAAGGTLDRHHSRRLWLWPVHRRARRALRRRISRRAVIPVGGGFTERQVQLIRDFKPTIIMVTPSYMLAIADEFERQGLEAADMQPALGCSAPSPGPNHAHRDRARMGIQALDLYGLSEVMGPGVGGRNARRPRTGLTVWEDHFLPEIIDPETGAYCRTAKSASSRSPR
jgi:phenylacetate-CoA ligase